MRNDDQQPGFGSLLAFILSRPLEFVASRQLHFLVDLVDGFPNGGPQIAVAHFETDGDVA